MKRRAKTKQWVKRQAQDPYVKAAKAQGWRSRAALKLLAIDAKLRVLRPGMCVLDLGCAPGSWLQVLCQAVGPSGRVVGVDRLPTAAVPGAVCLQGDVLAPDTLKVLEDALAGRAVDLLLSDMAPNITGLVDVDLQQWRELLGVIKSVMQAQLKPGGAICLKGFHSSVFDCFRKDLQGCFKRVQVIKPPASRAESPEVYLFGHDYLGIMAL